MCVEGVSRLDCVVAVRLAWVNAKPGEPLPCAKRFCTSRLLER